MKGTVRINLWVVLFAVGQSFFGCNPSEKNLERTLLLPDLVSTSNVEYGCAFTPDARGLYFTRSMNQWATPQMISAIYYTEKNGDDWSYPKPIFSNDTVSYSAPNLSADGKRLFFTSKGISSDSVRSNDIWFTRRQDQGEWGKPVRLPDPINSSYNEYGHCLDHSGHLYFASDRPNGYGQGDLYIARYADNAFLPPENLGPEINSPTGEWNIEVNSEGTMLIFESSQRPENMSSYGDLYISFLVRDLWTRPQNLAEVNTTGSDLYPHFSLDESILYFSSSDSLEGRQTDIYSISFRTIEKKYRSQAVH